MLSSQMNHISHRECLALITRERIAGLSIDEKHMNVKIRLQQGKLQALELLHLLADVQKVSKKVSLASDFLYNHLTQDVTSSFGYDYILPQVDDRNKDYKCGRWNNCFTERNKERKKERPKR
ncbi:hypothetical protein OPV22_027526 [Ensete ventricosum]|uniref:Uncharacterized protein n=1 Tax=Ensete ventricosum TaxID=4639 RepID=A0AAV8Q0U6_ENSVE|nr:hypothetical protein OPV22_027526 [Ensete ventricosum]